MKLKFPFFSIILVFSTGVCCAQQAALPFPQHTGYYKGTILPNASSQIQLDAATGDFYRLWKIRFIKNLAGKMESYVWFDEKEKKQCVSEGQGYGMIIVALMAGYDPGARETYDRLYRYYRAHPSGRGKHLMAWAQRIDGQDLDNTSATDGDLDIAYSLLLAHQQWSDAGEVNYLAAAKNIIADIMQFEINHQTWSVLLSDGVEQESKDYFDTRSSDFMPSHFKAFELATGDQRWTKVIDAGYRLFINFENKYSPDAGLISDFIVGLNKTPKPAPPHFLESAFDGCYNYNACRIPWRIGTDYLLTGDKRSKIITDRINRWIRQTTNNNTYNLSAGYSLEGNDLKNRYFEALSFIAPFAVSAMVDQKNQVWLNHLWTYLLGFKMKDFDYYDNTIKLLDMIIISGNYWEVSKS
jgi:endo-1,4-beta-D-glucanase Y